MNEWTHDWSGLAKLKKPLPPCWVIDANGTAWRRVVRCNVATGKLIQVAHNPEDPSRILMDDKDQPVVGTFYAPPPLTVRPKGEGVR
jgi:hypothetical protein